eukprot:TRINITY_DN3192_c0_g3_i2.p1 TRINITY_DN3192_c0_g3~~TRINITY_DN3192_c0_g3_i2.p1  ORF type:complete len:741 (+),score=118.41 TRINITY_DN3192_c0_g3_i2:179-2224(+)
MTKLESKLKTKEKDDQKSRRESAATKEKELQEKQKEQEQHRKIKQITTESKKNEEKMDKQLKDLIDKVDQLQRKLTKQQEETDKSKVDAEQKLNAMTVKYQASLKWYNVLETRAESAEKKSRLAAATKKRLDQALEEAKEAQKKTVKVKDKQLEAYKEKTKKLIETVRLIRDRKAKGAKDFDNISISSQDLEQPATPPPEAETKTTTTSTTITTNGVTSLGSPSALTPRRARSNTNASQLSTAGSVSGDTTRDSQSRARRDSQSSNRSEKGQLKRTPSGRKTPSVSSGSRSGGKMNGISKSAGGPGAKASRIPGPRTPSQTALRSARVVDKETRERLKAKVRGDLDAKVAARRDARALKSGIPAPAAKSPPIKSLTPASRLTQAETTVPSLLDSSTPQEPDGSEKTEKPDVSVDKDSVPIPLDFEEKESDGRDTSVENVRETPSAENSHDSSSIAGSDVGGETTDSRSVDDKYHKVRPTAINTSMSTSTTVCTNEDGEKKTPREKASKKPTSRPPSVLTHNKASTKRAQSVTLVAPKEQDSPTGEKKARIVKPVVIKGGHKKASPAKPKTARPASRGDVQHTPSKRGPALIKRSQSAKQAPTAATTSQPLITIPKDKIKKKDGGESKKPPPAVNKPPPFSHSLLDFNLFSEGLDSLTDLGSILPPAGQTTTGTTSSPPESP